MKKVAFLGLKRTKDIYNCKCLKYPLQNNRGQILIESVLLMVVLLSLFFAVSNYAREKKLLSNLVEKPMQSLAIMVGFGVWKSADGSGCKAPGKPKVSLGKCHPNSIARSLSSNPKL